jgi:hypothetical protein
MRTSGEAACEFAHKMTEVIDSNGVQSSSWLETVQNLLCQLELKISWRDYLQID